MNPILSLCNSVMVTDFSLPSRYLQSHGAFGENGPSLPFQRHGCWGAPLLATVDWFRGGKLTFLSQSEYHPGILELEQR